jgi:hypothetical protein
MIFFSLKSSLKELWIFNFSSHAWASSSGLCCCDRWWGFLYPIPDLVCTCSAAGAVSASSIQSIPGVWDWSWLVFSAVIHSSASWFFTFYSFLCHHLSHWYPFPPSTVLKFHNEQKLIHQIVAAFIEILPTCQCLDDFPFTVSVWSCFAYQTKSFCGNNARTLFDVSSKIGVWRALVKVENV